MLPLPCLGSCLVARLMGQCRGCADSYYEYLLKTWLLRDKRVRTALVAAPHADHLEPSSNALWSLLASRQLLLVSGCAMA